MKGPGYYEKKHKFTRRITRRGNPPLDANLAAPTSTSSYTSSTTYGGSSNYVPSATSNSYVPQTSYTTPATSNTFTSSPAPTAVY